MEITIRMESTNRMEATVKMETTDQGCMQTFFKGGVGELPFWTSWDFIEETEIG